MKRKVDKELDFILNFAREFSTEEKSVLQCVREYSLRNIDPDSRQIERDLEAGSTLSETLAGRNYDRRIVKIIECGELSGALEKLAKEAVDVAVEARRKEYYEEYIGYHFLGVFLNSGIPILEATTLSARGLDNANLIRGFRKVHDGVMSGENMGDTMLRYPEVFEEEDARRVLETETGNYDENTNRFMISLVSTLQNIAEEKKAEMNREYKI